MKSNIILMKCITNLHVGSGEENYNLVDNEVEKDCVTQYPTIHASGIKGALREYFEKNKLTNIDEIFGTETKGEKSSTPGKVKFLSAEMIARPLRATTGDKPYHLVTTEDMITRFNDLMNMFDLDLKNLVYTSLNKEIIEVEGIKAVGKYDLNIKDIYKTLYQIKGEELKSIDLPVIARNKLNNGISEHLWFEEVVPHESLFVFVVNANDDEEGILNDFINKINGKVVQFGGNASVGCGFCKLSVLNDREVKNNEQ